MVSSVASQTGSLGRRYRGRSISAGRRAPVYGPHEAGPECLEFSPNDLGHAVPVFTSFAHYAVAAIHPFTDGNGRVARALHPSSCSTPTKCR